MFKFNNISYKNLNPKRKIKPSKPTPTPLSPPSPASFVSPEIFEIHGPDGLDTLHEADEYAHIPSVPSRRPPPSPRVQLEYSPEPISDWFSKSLLESDAFSFLKSSDGISGGRTSGLGWGLGSLMSGSKPAAVNAGDAQNTKSRKAGRRKTGGVSRDGYIFLSEEGTPQYQSEKTQPPTFVNLTSSTESPQLPDEAKIFRKPAPIKIPDSPLHAKVQGPHYPVPNYPPSAQAPSGPPPPRPDSPASVDDGMSSAVSGTTLARALFANSFMLSDDRRTSRPRSSGVVRQDSATLPRGEHPFWRDRRISGGEIILSGSSGRGSPVPPVPPVPPNADLLYAAQHSARRSAGSSASSQHESPHRTPEFPEQPSTNFHEAETSQSDIFNTGDNVSRRISHTEAPSSTSLPVTSSRRILGARSSGSSSNASISPSPGKPGSLPENNRPESDKSSATSPQPRSQDSELLPNSAPSSGVPSVGSGSGLISDILDEYHSNSDSHRPLPSTSTSSIRSISSSASVSSYEGGPRPPNKRSYSGRSNRGLPSPLTEMRVNPSHARQNSEAILPSPGEKPQGRLPIGHRARGERPRSLQVPQTPESPSTSLDLLFPQTAIGSASVPYAERSTNITIPSLPPFFTIDSPNNDPVPRGIFNRNRSGSTPDPIILSSQDIDTFDITVAPDSADLGIGRSRGTLHQTFPETPSAFSPMFTPAASSSWADPNFHFDPSKAPDLPMRSAALGGAFDQPSLAQRVLSRSATSSGAGSPAMVRPAPRFPRNQSKRKMSLLLTPPDEEDVEDKRRSDYSTGSSSPIQGYSPEHSSEHAEPSLAGNGGPHSISPSTSGSPVSNSTRPKPLPPTPHLAPIESPVEDVGMQTNVEASAPIVPSDNPHDAPSLPMVEPSQTATPTLTPTLSTPPSPRPPGTPPPPLPLLPSKPIAPTSPLSRNFTSPPRPTRLLPRMPQTPSTPPPPPSLPQPSPSPSLAAQGSKGSRVSYESDLGAPPPYCTVVPDQCNASQVSNVEQADSSPKAATSSQTVSHISPTPSDRTVTASDSPSGHRRARVRPPLPAGPRKPASQPGILTMPFRRDRNGSVSSVCSSVLHVGGSLPSGGSGSSGPRMLYAGSPKFITPPPQWRGHTMEAAKWTFTSEELQGIVSRAIKQSAEASSIRLLRLKTLDDELPDEMHRLEMLRLDVKTRYKALSRRRWALLGSLSSYVDGTQEEESKDATANMRTAVDELAEVSANLDHLAEELHSTDEQIAQIKSLQDVHSASALAMALRKLNASFLRQVTESQTLRLQIDALEAERDEAWKQADQVAHDYDDLSEKVDASAPMTPVSVKSPSRRSSHLLALRKSSVRVSKAGLRQSKGNRLSAIGNVHRSSTSTSVPSAVRSTFSSEIIPPVPPIPSSRPLGIVTSGLPSRSSFPISTGTPSSGTRALAKVQEELYEMLGIPISTRGRRPQSMRSPLAESDESPSPSPGPQISDTTSRRHRRPSSLPGSDDLVRYYDVMTADRKVMLATIGMLSD